VTVAERRQAVPFTRRRPRRRTGRGRRESIVSPSSREPPPRPPRCARVEWNVWRCGAGACVRACVHGPPATPPPSRQPSFTRTRDAAAAATAPVCAIDFTRASKQRNVIPTWNIARVSSSPTCVAIPRARILQPNLPPTLLSPPVVRTCLLYDFYVEQITIIITRRVRSTLNTHFVNEKFRGKNCFFSEGEKSEKTNPRTVPRLSTFQSKR